MNGLHHNFPVFGASETVFDFDLEAAKNAVKRFSKAAAARVLPFSGFR